MIKSVLYKLASCFVNVYEHTRTTNILDDFRITPTQHQAYVEATVFKNGIPCPEMPNLLQADLFILHETDTANEQWDPIHIERRVKNTIYSIEIEAKVTNIALAGIVAAVAAAIQFGIL